MKPNASLKSRKVNFRLMALRPATSVQRSSLASAALRASSDNFCAMVRTSNEMELATKRLHSPLANQASATTLIHSRSLSPGRPHVLVAHYRHHRWHGNSRAHHLPAVPGLDLRGKLDFGRRGCRL